MTKKAPNNKRPGFPRVAVLAAMIIFSVGMVSIVSSQSSKGRRSTASKSTLSAERRMPNFQQSSRPVIDDKRTYIAERNITVDARTGKLRKPTPQETKELVASLKSLTNRSTDGLKAVTRADGTRQVNLQGRFGNVVLARPNPDGTTETRCVTTFDEATEFLGLRVETDSEAAARKAAKKTNE